MKKGDRVIIAHGTEGSPSINWFPWLRRELSKEGIEVVVPQFPTPTGQTLEAWFTTLNESAGDLGRQDILIGHSTGAIFLVNVLNRIKSPVKSVFLAGGFVRPNGNPRYDALNSSFTSGPFDWDLIRRNASKAYVYSGDNDPYVPFENGRELAAQLKVPHLVIPGGGHLNDEFGYTRFDRLLGDLNAI